MSNTLAILPRSLRIVLIFCLFLVSLLSIDSITRDFPMKAFLGHCMPHLIIIATTVIVGGILLWIIEEAIAIHIAPAIKTGLQALAHDVTVEVGKFPKSWESITQVMAGMVVHNPEVQQLASAGRIVEAAEKATSAQDEITVFIKSDDPAHWRKAAELLGDPTNLQPKAALTLAYRFWRSGDVNEAIRIAEMGLGAVQKEPDVRWKIQNSLAYYYTETADPKYEKASREYIAAARLSEPGRPEPIDTEGFVKITYGKTREEILEGVAIAEKARVLGAPFETYAKHIARAAARLKSFPAPNLQSVQ